MEIKYKNIATYKHKKATLIRAQLEKFKNQRDTCIKVYKGLIFFSIFVKMILSPKENEDLVNRVSGLPNLQNVVKGTKKLYEGIEDETKMSGTNLIALKSLAVAILAILYLTIHKKIIDCEKQLKKLN